MRVHNLPYPLFHLGQQVAFGEISTGLLGILHRPQQANLAMAFGKE